jgi:hypothetical protein
MSLEELKEIQKSPADEIWALFRENEKRFKETDRRFKQMKKGFQETREFIEAVGRRVDDLTGKWGKFVEGLVAPGAIAMFAAKNIELKETHQRVKVGNGFNDGMEIDILGVNNKYVVLIEVKSTLKVEDVNEHIKRLEKFKHFFPQYAEKKTIGAVAGIVIEENADKYAYKKGLFVIAQSGETVKILNDKNLSLQLGEIYEKFNLAFL